MDEARYSIAQTIGGKRGPLIDLAQNPGDIEGFIEAQREMYDHVASIVSSWIRTKRIRVKVSLIMSIHKIGFGFIDKRAGRVRGLPVFLTNSNHTPPNHEDVLAMLEDLCEFINDNQKNLDPVFLAAFFLWKFLWIHPFTEGNGSIGRLLSYAVLQASFGYVLPGRKILPVLLSENRGQYYEALSDADNHFLGGEIDVGKLEKLLGQLLKEQMEIL